MRGGQRQALLLMDGLRRAGHESLLLAREGGALLRHAIDAGHTARRAGWMQLSRESRRADIVHAHDAHAHTMAAVASRRPFVVSRRVAFPVGRSAASAWKYKRAARYLAVSRFVAGELAAAGVPDSKIDVVYDGVASARAAEAWDAASPIVALASRDPRKGRDLVEAAVAQAKLDVVFSDALERDLRRASLFVYVTRSEGLGSAALLAMSMGVPVIASRTGGLPEAIEHGVSGLLVENDAKQIADAMRRVLGDAALAQRLMAGAKRRVGDLFTAERMVRDTIASYERALAG